MVQYNIMDFISYFHYFITNLEKLFLIFLLLSISGSLLSTVFRLCIVAEDEEHVVVAAVPPAAAAVPIIPLAAAPQAPLKARRCSW